MKAEKLSKFMEKPGDREASFFSEITDTPPPRDKAYKESAKYFYSVEAGLELVFLEEDEQFCSINFTITPDFPDDDLYQGELPLSLDRTMTRQDVLSMLGVPVEAAGPNNTPMLGPGGGWDKFHLPAYPQAFGIVGYTPDLHINGIRIALEGDA